MTEINISCPNCGYSFVSHGKKIRVRCTNCGTVYSKIDAIASNFFSENPHGTLEIGNLKIRKPRGGSELSATTRNDVYERDGGKCVICGSRENLEFHHLIGRHRGIIDNNLQENERYRGLVIGSNESRNIVLICSKCHYLHTCWLNTNWWPQVHDDIRKYKRRITRLTGKEKKEIKIPKVRQMFPNSSYGELVEKQRRIGDKLCDIAMSIEPEDWIKYKEWLKNSRTILRPEEGNG